MEGLIEGGGPEGADDREETPHLTKEQIEGHVSALKSLIKSHNRKNKGDLIRLDFETVEAEIQGHTVVKGNEVMDEDLRKPFKEARGNAVYPPNHRTLNGSARGWFERLPHDSTNEWAKLREAFVARFSVRRACFKEPHEITKITRKANESLTAFKERWTVETDKVPATINEMMERLDDFVRSEEAYAITELLKGETRESHRKISLPFNGRDTRPFRNAHRGESRIDEFRSSYREETHTVQIEQETIGPHTPFERRIQPQGYTSAHSQLFDRAPKGNFGHRNAATAFEKGHYKNDCIQLRKQLEMDLESGKLNHLVKDVHQRGRGSHSRDDPQQTKIINVISVNSVKNKKRKIKETTKSWMNIPVYFPSMSSEDVFEEPLIVKAEVEGYLVRQVYVDEGSSVEVMFEHCFENLNPRIKDRRTSMNFIVVRAPSPYNIILGRPGLKALRAIPFTIHSMMKFPTPKGVATLVTQTVIIAECRRLEKNK
nr:reverse transcriptase domain-containing protein [Tanacetum cinerariifolium]